MKLVFLVFFFFKELPEKFKFPLGWVLFSGLYLLIALKSISSPFPGP